MKMVFPHARVSRSFGELANDMNTLVDTLFSAANGAASDRVSFTPPLDIHEQADRYVVTLDVPGVKPEAIEIDIKDDELVIQGSRAASVESKDEGFYRIERWAGEFRRSLKLPRTIDREQIEADCHDGVLVLSLPKTKATVARKINVRRSSGDEPGRAVVPAAEPESQAGAESQQG